MKAILRQLIAVWPLLALNFATAQTPGNIPRDTSYTIRSAYQKIKNKFPYASPAIDSLPKGIIAERDLIYATATQSRFGKRDLHLDIFRPAQKGKFPALIMVHGGGWRSGDKSLQVPMAEMIATKGFVTIPVEYQLSLEEPYPAAIHNIKAAIRWTRANARRFNIDPEKIAISGCSAGGQIAALVGFTNNVDTFEGNLGNPAFSSSVQTIIDIDGVISFLAPASLNIPRTRESADAFWLGGTFPEKPEIWKEASAAYWANSKSVPILFINSGFSKYHAGQDELAGQLKEWGIYHEVHKFNVNLHPFWLFHPWVDETVNYMTAFLDKVFKPITN